MKNLIVEIAQFKLAAGVSEKDFLREAEAVQTVAKIAKALDIPIEKLL